MRDKYVYHFFTYFIFRPFFTSLLVSFIRRNNAVGVVNRLLKGKKIYFSKSRARFRVQPTPSGYRDSYPGRDANHTTPSSAEFKNECRYTCIIAPPG